MGHLVTEQAPPEGSEPRPIPDLGFFAGPPTRGSSTFGGARPTPPIGPPATGQFGAAPGNQFGAAPAVATVPPPVYAPPVYGTPPIYGPPPGRRRGGLPGWVIVLICVSLVPIVIGVLAAIVIPVFLNQRAKALDVATTVTFPANIGDLSRETGPEVEEQLRLMLSGAPAGVRESQGAIYSGQSKHTLLVWSARLPKGSGSGDLNDAIAGFQDGLLKNTPPGVTVSEPADRDAGRLGGRINCATYGGAMIGQICLAVDSAVIVTIVDLVRTPDPDLPRRVREAVVHRS